MTFTPHISVYQDKDAMLAEDGNIFLKATWIFSKHFGFHKRLQRKRLNIVLGQDEGVSTFKSIKSFHVKNPFVPGVETSALDKTNQIVTIIYKAMKEIGITEGWDIDRIDKAYQLSLQDNAQFFWASELKSNRKKSLKARLKFTLETEGMVRIVSEVTETSSGENYEILLIETFPHFFDWDQTFKKPMWIDDEKYGFRLLDSQLLIFSDTKTRQSVTIISGTSLSKAEIEGHARMLTFTKLSSPKEWAQWANR